MTDDHSPLDPTAGPLDDEIVSAVLDGEATPAERALVEGSVEGRARLAELRAVAEATAEPVAPLPSATVEVLLGRALDTASTPTETPEPVELASRGARRDRGELWRRWGTAVAAAAAIVVVVAGIVALGRTTARSSSDSASSATAAEGGSSSATSTTAGAGAESARAADGVVAPNLGALSDADLVLDRYVVLVGLDPTIDHQFGGSTSSGSGSTAAADASSPVPPAEATAASTSGCPVPPIPSEPGETWTVTATAQLPTGPVLVMADGLAPPANRVLVVDAGTCAVLAERTL
jgi:hypothetical protein